MNQTILVIRVVLIALCALGGYSIWYLFPDMDTPLWLALAIALLMGALLVLVDVLIKGFSLRGLSGLTFGLLMGILASHLISVSPIFEGGDAQAIYIARVAVFISVTYLATVIALRGKDEFNLVIPYVRFEPERVEAPIVVLDSSALVDGRVVTLCKARMLGDVLFVPKFVVDELGALAASSSDDERNRGRRGLKTLSELRGIDHLDVRVYDSELKRGQNREEKILYVVTSLKGRLLSASESLVARAKQEGAPYIDMLGLAKTLSREVIVGEAITVRLVKLGKEDNQGVGYLEDGSMVVVNKAGDLVGATVMAEVESIIPTSGGRMVFGKLLGESR